MARSKSQSKSQPQPQPLPLLGESALDEGDEREKRRRSTGKSLELFTIAAQELASTLGVTLDVATRALTDTLDTIPKTVPRTVAIKDAYERLLKAQDAFGSLQKQLAQPNPALLAHPLQSGVAVNGGVASGGWANIGVSISVGAATVPPEVLQSQFGAGAGAGLIPRPKPKPKPVASVKCPHCQTLVPPEDYHSLGSRGDWVGCSACLNQYAARMRDLVGMSAAFAQFAGFTRDISYWIRSTRSEIPPIPPSLRARAEAMQNVLIAVERMTLVEKFITASATSSAIERYYNLLGVSVEPIRPYHGMYRCDYRVDEASRALALYLIDAHEMLYPFLREIAESLYASYDAHQQPMPILTLAYCDRRATLYDHAPFLLLDLQGLFDDERDLYVEWIRDVWVPQFELRADALVVPAPRLGARLAPKAKMPEASEAPAEA